jgi:PhnB protein
MNLNIYLAFSGNCEEALKFYAVCLEGKITQMNYFKDSPMEVQEEQKNKVLHAELQFKGGTFMASDSLPINSITRGDNVNLSINFDDIATMEKYFAALSDGGMVTMPLQDQFWGARFGMVRDKYGVNWMFNCNLENK